ARSVLLLLGLQGILDPRSEGPLFEVMLGEVLHEPGIATRCSRPRARIEDRAGECFLLARLHSAAQEVHEGNLQDPPLAANLEADERSFVEQLLDVSRIG